MSLSTRNRGDQDAPPLLQQFVLSVPQAWCTDPGRCHTDPSGSSGAALSLCGRSGFTARTPAHGSLKPIISR